MNVINEWISDTVKPAYEVDNILISTFNDCDDELDEIVNN
jgi:hypothetical protein